MPVLSNREIKYMITLHKKNILQFFSLEILDWEIFQAILGKFRGNSERRPSFCLGFVGRTVSSRILQLCTVDQHDEWKMTNVSLERSKLKVVLSHSRKTLQTGYRMHLKVQDHTNWYN